MIKYEPISYGDKSLPEPTVEVVDCPRCHFQIPVPLTFTDWQQVSEDYKKIHETTVQAFEDMIDEIEDEFKIPIKTMMKWKMDALLLLIKQLRNRATGKK